MLKRVKQFFLGQIKIMLHNKHSNDEQLSFQFIFMMKQETKLKNANK